MLIKPIYTTADWSPPNEGAEEISGEFPYKRGHMATMYSAKPWTVRQYAGFSTVEESNTFYKAKLTKFLQLQCYIIWKKVVCRSRFEPFQ